MIYDLDVFNQDFDQSMHDVCIVGAGAAGITIAKELGDRGYKIALCEAGGLEYTASSQDNYKGEVIGDPYFDLDVARLRFLGGSTNHWRGWCRDFEKGDFARDYLGEEYKWPMAFEELAAYRNQACKILEIPNSFDVNNRDLSEIKKIKFQFSPPVNFKEKYQQYLSKSPNISLFINANLEDISGVKGQIRSARFRNYKEKSFSIQANKFVFSMGGIENSRYLLWFAKQYGGKYFDDSTPIGKYWMEHPIFGLGQALVEKSVSANRFYSLSYAAQKRSQILNCGFRVDEQSTEGTNALLRQLACVAPALGRKMATLVERDLICGAFLSASWEQAPKVTNAVTLSDDTDQFDVPKVVLRWQKNAIDRKTIKQSVRVFNDWLLQSDRGRIQLSDWLMNDLDYPIKNHELAGYHHMGGTRMSNSNKYGVVDNNCKVYNSDNLYMAGSSIFTTGGHNNPTLPIIEFSLRLAEHLRNIL